MKNTPHNILSQFFHDHIESMHSLPEHVRKIFMVASMIFATTFVGLLSWLLFPPLQDIGLPSLNTRQQVTNNYQPMDDLKQIVKDSKFANVVKIPEIGPASGFMQSFKAVQDLIVPKNLQNPLGHAQVNASWTKSWLTPLAHASAGIALKLREASVHIFQKANNILLYIINILVLSISYVVSSVLHVISYMLYALSYLARLPSYIAHLIDLFISSTSRIVI
ncbi:MAG: hypothetical protein AAB972_02060 [Patescibacteria group bacterium]